MTSFSFVGPRIRNQLKLSKRNQERKEVVQHTKGIRSALGLNNIFSDELLARVKSLSRTTYSAAEINEKRTRIVKAVGARITTSNATTQLKKLMALYDELFFNNTIEDGVLAWKTYKSKRTFRVESKVSKDAADKGVAGITYIDDDSAGIKIDIPTVLKTEFNQNPWVGRVPCNDIEACICLLVEHELCHLWCFLFRDSSMKYGVHSGVFKSIMRRLFKQLTIHHKLGTPPKNEARIQSCEDGQCPWVAKE